MPGAVAGIALPEGDPGAIFDAARELQSIAGAFEGGGGVVSSGVAQVGSWQGQASASFRALAGSYEQAARTSAAVLQEMAGAVRAYGREFRDAYERVKRLQERAEECLREIDLWEARRDDAAYRERALQAERRAASQVLSAVDGLPAVGMPGGPANGAGPGGPSPAMSMVPAVYRGGARSENAVYRGGAQSRFADFSIQDILGFSRDVDRDM